MIKKYKNNINIIGFWIYIMNDCIIFTCLFIINIIYKLNFNKNINYNFNILKINTFILLLSTLTCSYCNKKNNYIINIFWLLFTKILGVLFIILEIYEFKNLIIKNINIIKYSYFSSIFLILNIHLIHIIIGIIWILILIIKIIKEKMIFKNIINLKCFTIYWHFLDIIWIIIFTYIFI